MASVLVIASYCLTDSIYSQRSGAYKVQEDKITYAELKAQEGLCVEGRGA